MIVPEEAGNRAQVPNASAEPLCRTREAAAQPHSSWRNRSEASPAGDAECLAFENPTHDFPRRIEYRRAGADAFEAHVSDGGEKSFRLSVSRDLAG